MPNPANQMVCFTEDGQPLIRGFRCTECGAAAAQHTLACRRCLTRDALEAFRATETGKLVTWSVVERSYPGIEVPFVSAIIDLDDGLTLKGTLRDCDAGALAVGMPVKLVFDDAGGARDDSGEPYVGYHFVPAPQMEGAS